MTVANTPASKAAQAPSPTGPLSDLASFTASQPKADATATAPTAGVAATPTALAASAASPAGTSKLAALPTATTADAAPASPVDANAPPAIVPFGALPPIPGSGDARGGRGTTAQLPAILPPITGPVGVASNDSLPQLAPPAMPALDMALPAPMAMPGSKRGATTLPEVNVSAPKKKSWQTVLAPTVIPPKTSFNYRRAVLPDTLYGTRYSRDNQHLPRMVRREDYARLLFERAAANDVSATRALLNAGVPLEIRDPNGLTPLAAARRSGATDTARLLIARGANG